MLFRNGRKERVPGHYLTQQSDVEKVGQFEEDDNQFDLHFFFFSVKLKVTYIPSAGLAALISGDPKHVSCSSLWSQ